MLKNLLYALATILLLASVYFIYEWFKMEPSNREPLPALLSAIATIVLTIIVWRLDGPKNESPSNAVNVIHTGTGDNIQGDKKVYNIGKIDKADFS
jgi:CDP-diglyceride synthetase